MTSLRHAGTAGTFGYEIALAHLGQGDALSYQDLPLLPGDRIWNSGRVRIEHWGAGVGHGLSVKEIANEAESLLAEHEDSIHLIPIEWLANLVSKPRVVIGFQLAKYMRTLFQQTDQPPRLLVLMICAEDHWFLLTFDTLTMHARSFDGLAGTALSLKHYLADTLAGIYNGNACFFPDDSLVQQGQDDFCGIIALVNLGWQLELWQNFSYEDVRKWCQSLQREELIRGQGASDYATAHAWLVKLLPEKGVAEADAAERAALALKKLGTKAILGAINDDNPWRKLKAIGNNANRPFQWVTPDELQGHISFRASQKFGVDNRPKKKAPRSDAKPVPTLQINPDALSIPNYTFVDEKGDELKFLPLVQIKADSAGITVASIDQAQRFLQDSKHFSTEALGMLTTTEIPKPHIGNLIIEDLTWPALFENEPLLIRGSLVQLGDLKASLKTGPTLKNTAIKTALMRFQDQWSASWDLFIRGPLKQLVQAFPQLQVCTSNGCGLHCLKYHPPVDEPCDLLLLDCFAWRWFTTSGSSTSAAKASSFSIMVRLPAGAVDSILLVSGREGFYPELRDDSDGKPSRFSVIWLKVSHADALHLMQTQQYALHLAQLHQKYGLRCLRQHEAELRKQIFPDQPFVDCEVKCLFQVGPWDYGVNKITIQDFLQNIPWKAKVLKPARGGPDGRFWLVGASEAPAGLVYPCGQSQITIAKVKDTAPSKPASNVVASLKTMQRLHGHGQERNTSVDPWLQQDPWAAYRKAQPATAGAASSSAPSKPSKRLDEVEARLQASVQEQIQAQLETIHHGNQDEAMDDSRLSQLESNVEELRHQQGRFEQWFHTVGEQIHSFQSTLQEQDQTIQNLAGTVKEQGAATETFQAHLGSLESSFKTALRDVQQAQQDAMQTQTERLEMLFTKRARNE